ncbi:amino acid ABC transporter permease [Streptomyces sp. NPDC001108]
MAWDEWERLKSEAAARRTDPPGGGGDGGGATLRHTRGPWTKAAATADELQTRTITAGTDLRGAHDGTADGLAGLSCRRTLGTVLTSWDERLGRVRDECGSLEPKLRRVAVELGEADAEAGRSVGAVVVPGTRRGE